MLHPPTAHLAMALALAVLLAACGRSQPGAPDAGTASGCGTTCTIGEAECLGDQPRTCIDDGAGCGAWGPQGRCPTDAPFCSSGVCEAKCSDECLTVGDRRCHGAGFQICGNQDSDPCLEWSTVVSCGSDEVCRATDAECVESCGGAACACATGETTPCAAVGECTGGVRQCVAGEFGACQWQVGPKPEICDGLDNDCNGIADDPSLLAPPNCALQSGVCAGATQRCGGSAGWLACTGSVYLAHAATYQVTETSCDSLDNDCDGQTDEPSQCCTPSCLACGASDGCGGICQTGSCSGNLTCDQGVCVVAPNPTWQTTAPITTKALHGIWGASASNIWVVGDGGTLLHYNGAQWSSVLSGTVQDLRDVWGSGPNDVWAVGGTTETVIIHYNGAQWTTTTLALGAAVANAVWGTSPTNVFVAGGSGTFGYISRYNGVTWSSSHAQTSSRFMDIGGASGSDVWAVDLFAASHFDGSSWGGGVTFTSTLMRAVWIGASNNGWAIGDTFALQHFDGTSWQQVASPLGGSNDFGLAVWGRAANDVWAVGSATGHRSIIHFDGAGWQLVGPTINAGFYGVWGASATNVWVVGSSGTILHYAP